MTLFHPYKRLKIQQFKPISDTALYWRPSWTPSWISQNPQGWAAVIHRICGI